MSCPPHEVEVPLARSRWPQDTRLCSWITPGKRGRAEEHFFKTLTMLTTQIPLLFFHFRVTPLFQNESSCKTFYIKMSLIFTKMNQYWRNTLSVEWLPSRTILIGWHVTVSVTSIGLFDTNVKKIIIKFSTVQHVQLSFKVTIVQVIFVQLPKLHIRFVWL